MLSEQYINVSDLNSYIKTYLENNYFLQDIYVKGEISNFKRHQSGTLYFAIKDEKSAINVCMFSMYASRLKVSLKDGDLVLIRGKINLYEPKGTYSINAVEIIFDSKGMLLIQFEQLKEKLFKEGLFNQEHKKNLPRFPLRIGLITAPYGAAIQDMLRTIKSRWPLTEVYIYPSLVQGNGAKEDIVKKIKLADNDNLDVIICGRGGGSIEDLWPFNEEIVARAFYECNTPIISAVGHEIDTTISDYVADVRALTPTDGAVKATPNLKDVLENINVLNDKLCFNIENYLKHLKTLVSNLNKSYVLTNPLKIYENYRFKIDDLENSLFNQIGYLTHQEKLNILEKKEYLNKFFISLLHNKRNDLVKNTSKLDSLSPLKVLNRGYAFATINNKVIKKVDDVGCNDLITLSFSDGTVNATVISKEKKHNGK